MSKRVHDILHHKHGFPAGAVACLDDDDLRTLVGMVRAVDAQTNRMRALDLLVAGGAEQAMELLAELLRHDGGDALLSAAAATHVTRFPAQWAEALLLNVLQATDAKQGVGYGKADASGMSTVALTKVVASLGRCGGKRAIPALQALADDPSSDPMVSKQSRFALALIGCREGLRGFEPAPADSQALHPDTNSSWPVRVHAASAEDVEQAMRSVAGHLHGVQPNSEHALGFACGGHRLLVLLNQALDHVELPKLVLKRPWLAALVTRRSAEDQSYSVWRIVLTHPQDGQQVRLTVHRNDGKITFEGQAVVDGDSATLSLHTIALPGATAATIEGILGGTALEALKVRSGDRRLASNAPQPWMPPRG